MTIWHICHILNVEKELEITMDKFEVEFYTKDNGEKPAKDLSLVWTSKCGQKCWE